MQFEAIDAFDARLTARLSEIEGVEDRVRALSRTFVAFADEDPARFRLLEALTADPRVLFDDEVLSEGQAHLEPVLAKCASVIEEGVAAGVLAPGDTQARVFLMWETLQGLMLFRKQDPRRPESLQVAALTRMLEDIFLQAWSSAPAA